MELNCMPLPNTDTRPWNAGLSSLVKGLIVRDPNPCQKMKAIMRSSPCVGIGSKQAGALAATLDEDLT